MTDRKLVVCETHGFSGFEFCPQCQPGANIAWGPVKQQPGGQPYRVGTSTGVTMPEVPPGMEFPGRRDDPLTTADLAWQKGVADEFNACMYRGKCAGYRLFLMEAHRFLNAQQYTDEEIEDYCKRLNAFLGIPNDI